MATNINGTAGNDVIDKTGSALDYKITAGSGADTVVGGLGADSIDGGSENDLLNGGAGNDTLVGGSGNDTAIYVLSENTGATDRFDGGSGTGDRLRLDLTTAEWFRSDVQSDITSAQQYIAPPGGKAFDFTAFDLWVKNVEYLDISVGGISLSAADDPIVAHNDSASLTEDTANVAINLLANDSAPDLIKSVEILSGPSLGSVSLSSALSNPASQSATLTFTPGAAFQGLNSGETSVQHVTYRITDADGDVSTATVDITVTGLDDGPFRLSTVATSNQPRSIATADFNGDGKADLAISEQPSQVEILLGDGLGNFTTAGTYAVGSAASGDWAADVTGDGRADVLVVDQTAPGALSVLVGHGDGSFGPIISLATGAYGYPAVVRTGDVNGDGTQDMVVTNNDAYGGVTTFLSDGSGGFSPGIHSGAGLSPVSVSLGDINLDGKLDIVVSNYFSNELTVHLGNGDGSFNQVASLPASNPHYTALADFNHDGKLDAAVVNTTTDNVNVFLGNGDGSFGPVATYSVGGNPSGLVAGDFNHDGDIDLISGNYLTSNISILLGVGDGTFSSQINVAAGPNYSSGLTAGDWNNDGWLDLAGSNVGSSTISVLINTGDWIV